MGPGAEQRASQHRASGEPHWSVGHVENLNNMGWRFVNAEQGGINSKLIAYHDQKLPSLIRDWQASQAPVELSIVAVMPNENLGRLPARALGYAATALSLADSMQRVGVNISTLRIVSPCRINTFCNGGNEAQQVDNAQRFQALVQSYRDYYLPQMSPIEVTLDTGKPVSDETLPVLIDRAEQIREAAPELTSDLLRVSGKYNQDGQDRHPVDLSLMPLIYLLSHPEAWGYSGEEVLFARNGEQRINFMPASELRYLSGMKQTEGIWTPSTDKAIGTVISAKQTTAPYYPMANIPEPTIEDLVNQPIEVFVSRLRPLSGRREVPEIVDSLNQLKTHVEQSVSKRRKGGLAPAPSLRQLIEHHLE